MDHMEFVKDALAKYGKASVNADLTNACEVFHITWKLGCWVKYDRAADRYEFKP